MACPSQNLAGATAMDHEIARVQLRRSSKVALFM
jgi:hypothetical protein